MRKFASSDEAIRFYKKKGYEIADPPPEVLEKCFSVYGVGVVYLIEPKSGADIFIIEGEPIAALHRIEDGSVDIDLP